MIEIKIVLVIVPYGNCTTYTCNLIVFSGLSRPSLVGIIKQNNHF